MPRGAQLLKSLRAQAEALWGAINQRGILLPALFVFLWQVCAPCPLSRHTQPTTTAVIARWSGVLSRILTCVPNPSPARPLTLTPTLSGRRRRRARRQRCSTSRPTS